MPFIVFLLILLSNYVALADIAENSKTLYFTLLAVVIVLKVVLSIL